MPSNNFTNSKGNFTVSDQPFANRTEAMTMGWSFEDFEALHGDSAGLNMQDILVGSPEIGTYRHWFENSGLLLYTNP